MRTDCEPNKSFVFSLLVNDWGSESDSEVWSSSERRFRGGIHEHEKEELKNLDDVAGSFVQ